MSRANAFASPPNGSRYAEADAAPAPAALAGGPAGLASARDAAPAADGAYTPRCVLLTGGCGFIGSHVLARLAAAFPRARLVNLDKMTYCASPRNVEALAHALGERYVFVRGSVCSADLVAHVLATERVDTVMHFAAESHVDASFGNSLLFTENNVVGTHTLLECCRVYGGVERFVHVSTDEVYGETPRGAVTEHSATAPTNPYAASKAAAEQYAEAYFRSYNMPIIVTRGNNVYGPHQFLEKVVPKFTTRLARGLTCCLHGSGASVRNFLYVDDVADAFVTVLARGAVGETYNIGTDVGISMRELALRLVRLAHPGISDDEALAKHVECVEDRAFNDQRYDISTSKLHALGWAPRVSLDDGLTRTHAWYRAAGVEARWDTASVAQALRPHPGRG